MIGQIYPAADDALCLGRGAPVVPGRGLRAIQGEMVAPDIDLQEPDACCLSVAKVSGIGPPAHLPARNSAASRSEQLRTFAAMVIASPPLPQVPKQ
jgi:hypothetical protein